MYTYLQWNENTYSLTNEHTENIKITKNKITQLHVLHHTDK